MNKLFLGVCLLFAIATVSPVSAQPTPPNPTVSSVLGECMTLMDFGWSESAVNWYCSSTYGVSYSTLYTMAVGAGQMGGYGFWETPIRNVTFFVP